MAAADFSRSLKLVLIDEGGLDDDPHDHGGRTAHGIIQREYDAYRRRKNLSQQDVWKITPEEVTAIYHDNYWSPWCDKVPAGIDYAFFDFGVNAGPVQATRTLQRVLGVRVDGHMGPVTMGKLLERADYNLGKLIKEYCEARRAFYRNLRQFPRYGRGWLARVDHVEHGSMEIAAGAEATRGGLSDDLRAQATARARAEDTKTAPVSTSTAGSTSAAAGVLTGLVDKLHDLTNALQPYAGAIHSIEYMLVAVALVSAVFSIYGLIHDAKVKEATA